MLWLAILLAVVTGLVFIAWSRQEHIVFQPPAPPGALPSDAHVVEFTTSDSIRLRAFVVGNTGSTDILLAFHGNAVEAHSLISWATEVNRQTGWSVVLPEYRGYAGLAGSPSYDGSKLDARAALAVVNTLRSSDSGRIGIYGHSIGSAIATELARESSPSVLILESPLTSARDMARVIVGKPMLGLWKWMSRVHYDTEQLVRSLNVPVWIAHGGRDLITPVSMGRRVHAAALHKGSLLVVDRAGHNDVAQRGGEDYWGWMRAALR